MADEQDQSAPGVCPGGGCCRVCHLLFGGGDTHPFGGGDPILGSNLWRQYKRVAEKAGIPHISIHGIRHMLATFLIASGEDPRTVADLLGHSRTSVTVDTYSHVMPHRKRELARSIERLVMGGE
jgi:integrase